MGKYVPTAISYANTGLVKDKNAFVLSDDAFQDLENAFVWRGRIRRRQGFEKLGQLQRNFNQVAVNTVSDATTTINLYTEVAVTKETNARIVPGDANNPIVLTIAAPGSVTLTDDNGDGTLTSSDAGKISAATINYLTGVISVTTAGTWAASVLTVDFGYAPCLPVMGLRERELDTVNAEQLIAFDTKYVYRYDGTNKRFIELAQASSPAKTWTGSNSDFFYSTNYWRDSSDNKLFWVTNFYVSDPIRYYDGSDFSRGATEFEPYLDDSGGGDPNKLWQAKLIIPYKGRLVMLNTWEGATSGSRGGSSQFPQRARWSQNGSPVDLTDGWRSDVAGRGGYVDCPTTEHIVSADFIRDVLIVGFERSTWALRYTGNEILPFVWERINRELGADSTFSMVPFDQGILYVGDKTINSCTGTSVERIDESIPDQVFEIHNGNDGPIRVHGIRDFFERLVYWIYPDADADGTYPNRMLVFNYHNGSWAKFTDSFTCLGKYQQSDDRTWADLAGITWGEANFPWNDPSLQSDFPDIVAGNQQGYVLVLNKKVSNAPSLHIGAIVAGTPGQLTVVDHNIDAGTWLKLSGISGDYTEYNGALVKVSNVTDSDTLDLSSYEMVTVTGITAASSAVVTASHNFSVGDRVHIFGVAGMTEINGQVGTITAATASTFTLDIDSTDYTTYTSGGGAMNLDSELAPLTFSAGTYTGGGEICTIPNFTIRSKKFNMVQDGRKNFLGHIDFLANVTDFGEVRCEIYTDYSDSNPINDGTDTFFNTVFSTAQSSLNSSNKEKEWQRFYCTADAQFWEFNLTLEDNQLVDPRVSLQSDLQIDAFIVYTERGSRIVD